MTTLPIPIDNQTLPGWTSEREMPFGRETQRVVVRDPQGVYAGTVVYVHRTKKGGGTEYGWRPDQAAHQSRLTSKIDAVRRLPRVADAITEGDNTK